ncbi:MAG: protease modulator HflC [Methylacidiphilales bacterium]|nr:protease modulator HflC [Candidatus Methylacidiphilales bacterium]
MKETIIIKIGLGLLALTILTSSFYQVREDQFAISKFLGKIGEDTIEPGFHFKIPILTQIYLYDRKLLSLDQPAERFLTLEKKNLLVDYFIRYRISNLKDFYTNVSGDETIAARRLISIVNDILKSEFSRRTVREAITSERDIVTKAVLDTVLSKASNLGITVIDVRVKRVDFPESVSDSVYERMIKERASVAKEFRSEGKEQAIQIQAKADRDREQILAQAYKQSQILKGQGDAKASQIYARAYGKNVRFFKLYRSLEAYKKSYTSGNDILVIDGDSEFMRYFKDMR